MNASCVGLAKDSLVSVWRSPHNSKFDQFECSGVFVGNGLILTVSHAFPDDGERWIRPYVDATQTYAIMGRPICHPDLDAALVRIEVMPRGSAIASLDTSGNVASAAQALSLNGYFEGHYEVAHPVEWLSFQTEDRYHIVDVKQPKGHSGSGLANGRKLWGLTVGHYRDPNIHRGLALSLGQLWPSWLEKYISTHEERSLLTEVTPRHDVPVRANEIRLSIAANEMPVALKLLMDLVHDFGTDEEINEVVLLSMTYREVVRQGTGINAKAAIGHRVEIARGMLALLNKLLGRLRKEMGDG